MQLAEALSGRLGRLADVGRLEAQLERVAFNARQIEHVANQPVEAPRLRDDALEALTHRYGNVGPGEQHRRPGQDARQRRAQLVAHVLEELATDSVRITKR